LRTPRQTPNNLRNHGLKLDDQFPIEVLISTSKTLQEFGT
jgi:hypothetical protein